MNALQPSPVMTPLYRLSPLRSVRFGSFCDIHTTLTEVRFMPHSGRITRRQLTSA
jgi:hypothetical protein